ncbi:MAG: Hsp70 family protein [Spirochaetales bacterium]|nr:Hsp70 family protein [Spirochaetales bacterium]
MNIYCGIDFGTTNTVVSICGKNGQLVDSFSISTTLFIPEENQGITKVYIGDEAVAHYEENRPGRYIHSIKRSLSDKYFKYTVINRTRVTLEELLVLFLTELKKMIHAQWSITPENIVLGRPVKFSVDGERDKLAKKRLKSGFEMAGFKGITPLEEPVAASLCFENSLTVNDRKFLIVDLGGGTSDFTLVSYDPAGEGIGKYKINGVDGIDIGGDNFDEDVMLSTLSPQLGSSATYESYGNRLPMPVHIYRDICKWNKIRWYDKKDLAQEFTDYQYKSSAPGSIKKLKQIIENKLSQKILEKIRMGKHELAGEQLVQIDFDEHELELLMELTEDRFAEIISEKTDQILATMGSVLDHKYQDVDKVILTGGTSKVSDIQTRVRGVFSSGKVLQDKDFYNSISKGLALYAYYNDIKIV